MTLPSAPATAEEIVVAKLIEIQRLRDRPLADHGHRTAEIAVSIGGVLECGVDVLDRLYTAGQLHDIGKLAVTESTLWKPAGLSRAEWREIRTHPEAGHQLVAGVVHRDIAAAVLCHHERPDSSGYPSGIDGRTVPLVARVIQVADAFDAMTSGRPYQQSVPVLAAVEEIERCAGSQFDPEVAAALREVYDTRGDPRLPLDQAVEPAESAEAAEVIDLTGADPFGPVDPSPADPFENSPSMIRLRRSG